MKPQPQPIRCIDFKLPLGVRRRQAMVARKIGVTRGAVNVPIQNTVMPQGSCGPLELALHATENDILHSTFFKQSDPDHPDIAPDSPTRFCFAPLEERVLIVGTHLRPAAVKQSKLELYCRVNGQLKKFWTKTYTWKNCPKHFRGLFSGDLGPCNEATEKRRYPNMLESVNVVTDGTMMAEEFPDGVVTVARSPYMLRFSVTPVLDSTPVTEHAIWLYFDILPHSVTLHWGLPAMLTPRGNDVEGKNKAETLRLEKDVVLDLLTKANADPTKQRHEVVLDATHLNGNEVAAVLKVQNLRPNRRGTGATADLTLLTGVHEDVTFDAGTPLETEKEKPCYKLAAAVSFPKWSTGPVAVAVDLVSEKSQFPIQAPSKVLIPKAEEFASHKAVWGDGPRIPILAKIRVKKSDLQPSTTDAALKAVGPAECFWDWEDNAVDTKIQDWLGMADWQSTALTRDFLETHMAGDPADADAAPLGSNNCPVKYGGKRGVGATPVFLAPEQGAFPFPVTPAGGNRPWAAFSKCGTGDHAGKTGVLFQPSRMQGDRYRLVVYVAMDKTDFDVKDAKPNLTLRNQVLRLPAKERPPMAVSGEFEVFRRVKVNYFTFPANTPGSEQITDAAVAMKQVTGIILDVVDRGAPPASFTKKERFDEAHKKKYEGEGDVHLFLHHLWVLPQAQPDGTHLLHTRGFADYTNAVKNHFKTRPIFAVTVSDADPFERSGKDHPEARYVEVKSSGGAQGFIVARDAVLAEELDVPVFLLLAKNNTPFLPGETLTTIESAPKTSQIKKVLTEASGFVELTVKLGKGTDHRVVEVDIAGNNVRLTFPKKTFSSEYSKQLTSDHKRQLKTALVNAVNNRQTPLAITVSGDLNNDDGGLRISRVRGFIHSFFRDRILIDRAEVWREYCASMRSYHALEYFEMHAKRQVDAIFNTLLEKYAQEIKTEKGIYFFYFENYSKATYFVEGGVQASLGSPQLSVGYVVFPKPPHLTPRQQYLPAKQLLVHELAHAFFLNHNYKRAFETAAPDGTMATEIPEHIEHDTCIMNYDPDPVSQQFCGKCVLRLRGWNEKLINHKVDYDKAKTFIAKDLASAGDHAGWVHIRLAVHLQNGPDIQEAIKQNSKKAADIKWNRLKQEKAKEPWKSVIARRKELDSKGKDRTKREDQEFLNLKKREDEIDRNATAPLDAMMTLAQKVGSELRQTARPLVAEAEKAWAAFSSANAVGPGLGINMLRNMVLVHAKYGDVDKARAYYRQLTQISNHPLDLTGGNLEKDITSTSPLHHIQDLDSIDTSYYEVKVEIGDLSDIFAQPVSTPQGRKARLQVLGLFNRPLDHPQSDACLAFSWTDAKRLFPTLRDNDPGNVLDQEIKKFLISTADGKLPLAGSPAARLRRAAGYGPLYSQAAMMLQFPEWDYPRSEGYQEGMHEDEKPYSRYMLGGDPYEVEDIYSDANPALGKIPLKITVRKRPVSSESDGDFVPAANVRLYMQLVEPDALDAGSFNLGASNPVAGGTSYSTGAEPTALASKPAQFLKAIDDRLDLTHPSLPGDPQAFNKSSHIGGKGRLHPDGNITDPNDKILSSTGTVRENLLLSPLGNGSFVPFPQLADSKNEPHSISFDLDGNGEAKVVFAPSRIGGDRYKFRFYVGRPTFTGRNDSNITETATMVVWRTARISAYLKQAPHTGPQNVPAYLQAQVTQPGAPACLKTPPAPLADIDFSAEMTKELAKCFVELVVDPQALTSRPLSTQSANFRNSVAQLAQAHPWFVNCTFSQRYFRVARNGEGKPIDPKDGRILNEGETYFGSHQYLDSACWLKEPVTGTGKTGTATNVNVALRWVPFASSIKLVDFSAGENGKSYLECAIDDPTGMTGQVGFTVKPPLASARFDYTTRQLSLTFQDAAGAQPNYEVYYQGKDFADLEALILDFPAKSPFLFNLRLPADYNSKTLQLHGAQYPPMLKADQADFFGNRPYPHAGYFDDRVGGLVKVVFMEALARAVDNSGGFYPGIVLIQAVEMDNWGGFALQDGKAVGRTVYLLSSKAPQAPPDVKVLLHELAHALFLQHAPNAPGKQTHLHDPNDGCVMNYGNPANDGDFCGQCVAALRGLNAGDEPFVPS